MEKIGVPDVEQMGKLDEGAALLEQIAQQGLIVPGNLVPPEEDFAATYVYDGNLVHVTRGVAPLVDALTSLLRSEPAIISAGSQEEVASDLGHVLTQAALAREHGTLDTKALLQDYYYRLVAGQQTWTVLAPFPGLGMPAGQILELAGLIIGPLTSIERADALSILTAKGGSDVEGGPATEYIAGVEKILDEQPLWARVRMLRTAPKDKAETPGAMRRVTGESSASEIQACWVRATIGAQPRTREVILQERMQNAAAVLRVFAGGQAVGGLDPDSSLLNQVSIPGGDEYLVWSRADDGLIRSFSQQWARRDLREPYLLEQNQLDQLKADPVFQRARDIVERAQDPATAATLNEMERKCLLAMRQYASASTVDALEVKIQNYLTVAEMLFARDAEYNGRPEKTSKRLLLSATPERRQALRDDLHKVYQARQRPVHLGERPLLGEYDTTTKESVFQARRFAFRAIMCALQRGVEYTQHDHFIADLDRELGSEHGRDGYVSYAIVTRIDQATGEIEAFAPDLPECRARHSNRKQAVADVRAAINERLAAVAAAGGEAPTPTAITDKIEFKKPSMSP